MTIVVCALLGAFLGFAFAGGEFFGAAFGGVIGALIASAVTLGGRVKRLEQELAAVRRVSQAQPVVAGAQPAAAKADEPPPETALASSTAPAMAAAAASPPREPLRPDASTPARESGRGAAAASASGSAAPARTPRPTVAHAPDSFDVAVGYVKRWLTTGNVPVKVGVVLSVFGLAFLVKEGVDRQWLVLPLEARLVLVALFGIAMLALGWRLRNRERTYALSVQGGGVAVLYLTIYASFDLYHLLPAIAAFALLVVVTAAAGVLAVLQDSRALAVLGIVGGFMAPVLASDGAGNHVALFGYYAILNLAIVGIAWFKAWRELNVLGFFFTFGIASLWGYRQYAPEHFATTEPFLVLFVLMYLLIPILFASRQKPELRGFVDSTLVFGTPIVGFALQQQLVGDTQYGLAISAVVLAAFYVSSATLLHRRGAAALRVLVEAQFALAVAFLTVAVPLALDARWTSAAWSLQGAALIWLGFRQQRKLPLAAGVLLQLLSGAAYVDQPSAGEDDWPILNGHLLGATLLAFAGWFSGRKFEPDPDRVREPRRLFAFAAIASLFLLWASGWWLFAGLAEIDRFAPSRLELAESLIFVAATAWLAMLAADRVRWPRLNALGLVVWPAALFAVVLSAFDKSHPAADFGWLAWPAAIATMYGFLRAREALYPRLRAPLHTVAYWLAGALLIVEGHWQVGRLAGAVWPDALALALGAALLLATLRARGSVRWPLAAHAATYLQLCCGGAAVALAVATFVLNVSSAGDAAPLPYLPLLNPLELASVFAGLVLLGWLAALAREVPRLGVEAKHRAAIAGAFGWFVLTMTVARAVHHWADVPFDPDSLLRSTVFQTSLSIVWGASALTAMVIGARGKRRIVWLTGAGLMAVVVVKLFLVELGNSGTLTRIVSFLGVGVLLLVVGYFAPVPPRVELEKRAA